MKLLTKHTDYAVRALIHMAAHSELFIASSVIASEEGIPEPFLKRVIQKLIQKKVLISKEGAAGGVKLAKKPRDILLTDIMRLFQGEFQLSECLLKKKECPNRPHCVIRARIKKIEKMLFEEFAGISVASLLKDKEGQK